MAAAAPSLPVRLEDYYSTATVLVPSFLPSLFPPAPPVAALTTFFSFPKQVSCHGGHTVPPSVRPSLRSSERRPSVGPATLWEESSWRTSSRLGGKRGKYNDRVYYAGARQVAKLHAAAYDELGPLNSPRRSLSPPFVCRHDRARRPLDTAFCTWGGSDSPPLPLHRRFFQAGHYRTDSFMPAAASFPRMIVTKDLWEQCARTRSRTRPLPGSSHVLE